VFCETCLSKSGTSFEICRSSGWNYVTFSFDEILSR